MAIRGMRGVENTPILNYFMNGKEFDPKCLSSEPMNSKEE